MSELSLTILPETADDALAIERLHERTFGPGRYARTAYRIREGSGHEFGAVLHRAHRHAAGRLGAADAGARSGETPALLLGPLTVEPPFRERGIGKALIAARARRRRRRKATGW